MVDLGNVVSHVVLIYKGYTLPHVFYTLGLVGRDLTMVLVKILTEHGYSFMTIVDREIVHDMKETLGYLALDYEYELHFATMTLSLEKSYELRDEQIITINDKRFHYSETLFNHLAIS